MASELRRRTVATDTPSDATTPDTGSRDGSPVKISKQDLKAEKHHGHKKETRKRKSTLIFFLGSLFGIIAAGFLARSNDLIEFPEIGELSVDNILEALPAGLVRDMKELVAGERDFVESYDAFAVGVKAKSEGLQVHHPIIMIPGVISTGLESWGTANVSRPYFESAYGAAGQ
ncbi:hypothetical protein G7054_g1398 [Neopestalotiopsis clavispora]|nr:hypothetical protein G7054_g1398 [Neopestalotiopsis clavispora]